MSKTIKVSDQTHARLDDIRDKKETLGEAVTRVLDVYAMVKDVSEKLGFKPVFRGETK